jgi:hypothetical protein
LRIKQRASITNLTFEEVWIAGFTAWLGDSHATTPATTAKTAATSTKATRVETATASSTHPRTYTSPLTPGTRTPLNSVYSLLNQSWVDAFD